MLRLYLDNCCYNRPFDDRSNIKNYLEREAILIIMQLACNGKYKIIGSDTLRKEMSMISEPEKRNNVESLYEFLKTEVIIVDEEIIKRAEEIMKKSSIKAFDSLHLAGAEKWADILLTTDTKFLKAANRLNLSIRVMNPIEFLMEVDENDIADNKEQ